MSLPRSIPANCHLDPEKKTLSFKIDNNFPDIEDHFPDHPLVPAFVQLIWVDHLLLQLQASNSSLKADPHKGFHSVKFKSPVVPPSKIEIELKDNSFFEIRSEGKLSTTGKVKRGV